MSTQAVTMEDFEGYLANYIGSRKGKCVLLLDYDGTLSPIVAHADLAVLPTETRQVLERLSQLPDVFIGVVSGRNVANVKGLVGIGNITYAGNHGLEILNPDGTKYIHPMPVAYEERVRELLKELEDICHDGAWIENKGTVLTFHYRETPAHLRPDLIATAERLIKEKDFSIGTGHCVLEARPPVQWTKGQASLYILRKNFGDNWHENVSVIYAGDDVTDEDAMKVLKGSAVTFRITTSDTVDTAADHRLPSTGSVLTMLQWVERHLSQRKSQD